MNLPPGCTNADIDFFATCSVCHRKFRSCAEVDGDVICLRCSREMAMEDQDEKS